MKKIYFAALFSAICLVQLSAQPTYWEVGLILGGSFYRGDLTEGSVKSDEIKMGFGFMGRYNYRPELSFRGNLILSTLEGDDINHEEKAGRGYSFKTSLVELSGMVEYEPFGLARQMDDGAKILKYASPYISSGLGFAFTSPDPLFPNPGSVGSFDPIQQDLTSGYSKVHFIIPFNAGLKITIDREWLIGIEMGARVPFTDYLDGISESANPGKNDWYWMGLLNVLYKFM